MGLLVPRRGRRDAVQEPSFSSSLLTCHHALVLLLPSLQAISLAHKGEASLLPTPLPLPLFPVVSIFIGAFTFSKSKQAQWGSDKSGANKVAAHSARSEASFLIIHVFVLALAWLCFWLQKKTHAVAHTCLKGVCMFTTPREKNITVADIHVASHIGMEEELNRPRAEIQATSEVQAVFEQELWRAVALCQPPLHWDARCSKRETLPNLHDSRGWCQERKVLPQDAEAHVKH